MRKQIQPPATYKDWPKELQTAWVLEKNGFYKQASAVRREFHQRVLNNDPTTGVIPFQQEET